MPPKTFAQLAIENGLLSEAQAEECREQLAAEVAAGKPRRSLEETAVQKGFMTPEAARALHTALERLARVAVLDPAAEDHGGAGAGQVLGVARPRQGRGRRRQQPRLQQPLVPATGAAA